MYNPKQRNRYLNHAIKKIQSFQHVEGIVQIGSGVNGFSDEFSDVDLMVATYRVKDAVIVKDYVQEIFSNLHPLYMKEKQFSKDIYLLIVILQNKLEFNISIVPREFLSVKSPLWKVIVDKTGSVSKKMEIENERFNTKTQKYDVGFDLPFEFAYCVMSFEKALMRQNLIYALKMLETMRSYILIVQALNEDKKLHQFKAYDSLNPIFIRSYLDTYSQEISLESLSSSAEKLKKLFKHTIKQSSIFSLDVALAELLS